MLLAVKHVTVIIDLSFGKRVCSPILEERHMGAKHVLMGGVIFTLADFVCAIAANGCSGRNIVSRNVSFLILLNDFTCG